MGRGVWDIVIFTINGFAFMLIGLQLPSIAGGLATYPHGRADRLGRGDQPDGHRRPHRVGLPGDLPAAHAEREDPGARPVPASRGPSFVVSWAGMRGAVSLAAALALPLTRLPASATWSSS